MLCVLNWMLAGAKRWFSTASCRLMTAVVTACAPGTATVHLMGSTTPAVGKLAADAAIVEMEIWGVLKPSHTEALAPAAGRHARAAGNSQQESAKASTRTTEQRGMLAL
jgi:hypothetical protein